MGRSCWREDGVGSVGVGWTLLSGEVDNNKDFKFLFSFSNYFLGISDLTSKDWSARIQVLQMASESGMSRAQT